MAHVDNLNGKVMRGFRIIPVLLAAMLLQFNLQGQDAVSVAARLDTLLAGLPADNSELTAGIMEEIFSLGVHSRIWNERLFSKKRCYNI